MLDQLFVTTACSGAGPVERESQPHAAAVFAPEPEFAGLDEPLFG